MRWLWVVVVAACGRVDFTERADARVVANDVDSALVDGGTQPVAIATFSGKVIAIGLDLVNLYWTTDNGSVMQCPQTGCGNAPLILASGQLGANDIAVDGTSVYWTNYNFQNLSTVEKCAIGGCGNAPTLLAASQTPFEIASDATSVYWTNFNQQTVVKCSHGGCGGSPTVLAANITNAWGMAVDATTAYWSRDQGAGIIESRPIDGSGSATVLVDSQVNPSELVVDAGAIYWTSDEGNIGKCPTTGCVGNPFYLVTGENVPRMIELDATTVYWTAGGNAIRACPKAGGMPTTLVSGQGLISDITISSQSIFWGGDGVVMKLAR